MRRMLILPVALVASGLAGCFGGDGVSCEDPKVYATSRSAPPVRVPEGLSVPDESAALQIPSGEPLAVPAEGEPMPCLEEPPDFFEEDEEEQ